MTKIKLCGLSRLCDIEAANALDIEYTGFVFWEKSRRYVTPGQAASLKKALDPRIRAVGVFVDETPEKIAALAERGIIDLIQLHGNEDESYLKRLRELTDAPVIKAFRIRGEEDIAAAVSCSAEHIMLDAGMGTGNTFDWSLLGPAERPFFLAGGLNPENAGEAVRRIRPYAVDVSSGIETDGRKDAAKMAEFVRAVRKEEK